MFTNRNFNIILSVSSQDTKQEGGEEKVTPINERVKEVRKNLNLSQEEFGNRIGLSKSGISNIEKGIRNVTSKHVKLISTIFGIDELWLTTGIKSDENIIRSEKEAASSFAFMNYLKSFGYAVTVEKTGESEKGHFEDETDSNGEKIGQSWIPDEEYYSVTISNGKNTFIFKDKEFSDFQKNVERFISFELFKQGSDA